jgi:hypothetical protein
MVTISALWDDLKTQEKDILGPMQKIFIRQKWAFKDIV